MKAVLRAAERSLFHRAIVPGALRLLRRASGRSGVVPLSEARHILVVRLDQIGDVVLLSPFLRELRRSAPKASITLVVKPAVANLVGPCPYVNSVLAWDPSRPARFARVRQTLRAMRFGLLTLWRTDIDVAFSPRWDVDGEAAALVAYASGARTVIGYREEVAPWKEEASQGSDRFLTMAVPGGGIRHEVLRNLDLLEAAGGRVVDRRLEVWPDAKDREWADYWLRQFAAGRPVVALGVGAGLAPKRWPLERFGEVAEALARQGIVSVAVGSAEDETLGPLPPQVRDVRGKTTLRQLAALLARSRLFIGNDSGPMHIAAASGIPVIELCPHPLSASPALWPWPDRFAPWTELSTILRPTHPLAPCIESCAAPVAHCITQLTTPQVLSAATATLSQAA